MTLYEALFAKFLEENQEYNGFVDACVEMESYRTLLRIKTLLEDDAYSDEECFAAIEEIVCTFEDLGIGCGGRHDF